MLRALHALELWADEADVSHYAIYEQPDEDDDDDDEMFIDQEEDDWEQPAAAHQREWWWGWGSLNRGKEARAKKRGAKNEKRRDQMTTRMNHMQLTWSTPETEDEIALDELKWDAISQADIEANDGCFDVDAWTFRRGPRGGPRRRRRVTVEPSIFDFHNVLDKALIEDTRLMPVFNLIADYVRL